MSNYLKTAGNKGAGSYWGETGKYQNEYETLYEELVPESGKSFTVEGEMMRAVSKIYYDLFNNGGCNNTSGAVNFLAQFEELKIPAQIRMFSASAAICEYMSGYTDDHYVAADQMVDGVMSYIISKEGEYTENDKDMYDFSDEDEYYEDEDEDEDDWGY